MSKQKYKKVHTVCMRHVEGHQALVVGDLLKHRAVIAARRPSGGVYKLAVQG